MNDGQHCHEEEELNKMLDLNFLWQHYRWRCCIVLEWGKAVKGRVNVVRMIDLDCLKNYLSNGGVRLGSQEMGTANFYSTTFPSSGQIMHCQKIRLER